MGDILFVYISAIITSIYFSSATVLIIDSEGQKPLGKILKTSFGFILPLFLVNFITSVIVFGGYFLFLLPGILFSLFFTFSAYEVVLQNQGWLQAIKRSYTIVQKYFGEIFVRMLIMIGICILFLIIANIAEITVDKNIVWIIYTVNFVCQLIFGWFWTTYSVVLYKQVKTASESVEEKNIRWISIVSAIGWGIFLLLTTAIIIFLANAFKSKELQKFFNNYYTKNNAMSITPTPSITTQQSAGFREYSNPILGITFTYPNEWTLKDNYEKTFPIQVLLTRKPGVEFRILQPYPTTKTLEGNVTILKQELLGLSRHKSFLEESDIVIGGQQYHKVVESINDNGQAMTTIYMLAVKNGKVYGFGYNAVTDKYNAFLPEANSIINSFTIQ
jgi:hypothetical protein